LKFIIKILLFPFFIISLHAQQDSLDLIAPQDTLKTSLKKNSTLDTLVNFKALDSIKINLKTKKMKLVNEADLKMGQRKLNAKYIELDFEKSTLEAYAGEDSSGFQEGFPIMIDGGEEFIGEKIRFNFKTNKGVISQGETELEEGFYYGKKIKRVNENDFYIQEGYYTPCDELEPSSYFGSSEMKLEGTSKIYMDPIVFYIQDLPFLVYPFGLFFSTESGRKSGFVVPAYDFSDARGVVLENFGFYWAASDYWDTQFLADYFTKGGYLVKNQTRWKRGKDLSGNLNMSYGETRPNVNSSFTDAYRFDFNNRWQINPYQNFTANMSFASQNFNQQTQSNINRRVEQNVRSTANYNINLQKWGNLSTGFTRDQNIIDNTYRQTPTINYSLPNKTLFKILGNDFNLSGSSGLNYSHRKDINFERVEVSPDSSFTDTTFVFNESGRLELRPNISYVLPKLWHFNLTPSISGGMNIYNRKLDLIYNPETDEVSEELSYGVFSEYWYNYNLSLQTAIYGIANPGILGIQSFRHTFQPTLRYSFRPDQSGENFGFYQSYTDTSGRETVYSVFQKDGGGQASRRQSQSLNYTLNNKFEIKIDQGDTLEAKKLELMNLSLNGNYDFTLDSLKFSNVGFNIRTPALKFINFSGGGNFSLYDQDPILNDDGEITRYEEVNRFMAGTGKGLVRLTSVRFSINTSFSSEGISLETVDPSVDVTLQDTIQNNENTLGSRFSQRMNREITEYDTFGDNSPGYSPISVPWDVSLGLNYSLNQSSPLSRNESVNANVSLNFEPAPGWRVRGSFNYDVLERQLLTPNVSVQKDLGCWNLNFTWVPTGVHRHFRFSIGLNSAQLKDFMYEKTTSNYY
jgi:hypothetical protein